MPGGKSYILSLTLLSLALPVRAQTPEMSASSNNPTEMTPGVRPGDMIRLWVWREKDYSGDFPVDARGRVTLPVLGEITVSGHTAEQLTDTLREAYRKYLNNPSIDVTVLRRVVIQGEVVKPGLYPADATISIGELIALAGGVTQNGNRSRVDLLRNGRVLETRLGPGAVLQRSPIQSGDVIVVPQKSWFSRNGQIFLYGGVSLATAVLARLIVK
jgi:protein involved in polysaccharide export with SLBB domain